MPKLAEAGGVWSLKEPFSAHTRESSEGYRRRRRFHKVINKFRSFYSRTSTSIRGKSYFYSRIFLFC